MTMTRTSQFCKFKNEKHTFARFERGFFICAHSLTVRILCAILDEKANLKFSSRYIINSSTQQPIKILIKRHVQKPYVPKTLQTNILYEKKTDKAQLVSLVC